MDSFAKSNETQSEAEPIEVYEQKKLMSLKSINHLLLSGNILFILAGIFNFIDELFKGWSVSQPVLGYILYAFTVVSLIPVGIGINRIADETFFDYGKKEGRQTSKWIFIYAGTVLINLVLLGWPLMAIWTTFLLIPSRILGFYFLTKFLSKIKHLTDLKIGGFIYNTYGLFYAIISLLGGISSIAQDEIMSRIIFVFDGLVESALIIIVGSKLILDWIRIKNFIRSGKSVRYLDKVEERMKELQERTVKRKLENKEVIKSPLRENLTNEEQKKYEKLMEKPTIKKRRFYFSTNQLLIIFSIVVTTLLIASILLQYGSLIVLSTLIFSSFTIFIIFHLSCSVLIRREFILESTKLSLLFFYILIPAVLLGTNFCVLNFILEISELNLAMSIILSTIATIITEIIISNNLLRSKLNPKNLTLKEFIKESFSKNFPKINNTEMNSTKTRIANNEIFDTISMRIAERMKERELTLEEFDWKEKSNKIS